MQAFVPSPRGPEHAPVAVSSKVSFAGSDAQPNVETFSSGTDLVVTEAARGAGVGALIMRELLSWARERFPGRTLGQRSGHIGSISSSLGAQDPDNAARRNRLYEAACGFRVTMRPDGNGVLSHDPARAPDFHFLDAMYAAAAPLVSMRQAPGFAAPAQSPGLGSGLLGPSRVSPQGLPAPARPSRTTGTQDTPPPSQTWKPWSPARGLTR